MRDPSLPFRTITATRDPQEGIWPDRRHRTPISVPVPPITKFEKPERETYQKWHQSR